MYFNPYHIFLNDTFIWCHLFRDNIRKYKRIVKKKSTYEYREKNLEKYTLYFFLKIISIIEHTKGKHLDNI